MGKMNEFLKLRRLLGYPRRLLSDRYDIGETTIYLWEHGKGITTFGARCYLTMLRIEAKCAVQESSTTPLYVRQASKTGEGMAEENGQQEVAEASA